MRGTPEGSPASPVPYRIGIDSDGKPQRPPGVRGILYDLFGGNGAGAQAAITHNDAHSALLHAQDEYTSGSAQLNADAEPDSSKRAILHLMQGKLQGSVKENKEKVVATGKTLPLWYRHSHGNQK